MQPKYIIAIAAILMLAVMVYMLLKPVKQQTTAEAPATAQAPKPPTSFNLGGGIF